jgi:hypothetical protein
MAEKTIRQQPVTLAEVNQVVYIVHPTGGIDVQTNYTPVDETGTPVGERRTYGGALQGANAEETQNWINTMIVPELNAHEGT